MCVMCVVVLSASSLLAGDWPQILGPNRDGLAAADEKLADSWPKDGPPVIWQRDVGGGFAGVAVAGNTAIVFHRVGDEEVAEAMDAKTGTTKWKAGSPTTFSSGFSDDQGPRCTPIIAGDRVFVFGAQGTLRCLDLKTGKKIWQRDTHAEFKAPEGYFGAGSSPLVAGDKLLVNVGGSRGGAGIVAFDLATGKTVWQATDEAASYSSPVLATVDGTKHALFVTRMKTVSLDPDTGKVRFEFPFGKRGPTVNGATPIVLDGHLLVSAHYGVGATFAKISATAADEKWNSDDLISSQYMTPLVQDGLVYGIHGQERVEDSELRCLDPAHETYSVVKAELRFRNDDRSRRQNAHADDRRRTHPLADGFALSGTRACSHLQINDSRAAGTLQRKPLCPRLAHAQVSSDRSHEIGPTGLASPLPSSLLLRTMHAGANIRDRSETLFDDDGLCGRLALLQTLLTEAVSSRVNFL